MSFPRVLATLFLIAGLAACAGPLTVEGQDQTTAVSSALGEPLMPIDGGVWRMTGMRDENGEWSDLPANAAVAGREGDFPRPVDVEFLTLRRDPATGSYASPIHNLRFYAFDGTHLILEVHDNEAVGFYAMPLDLPSGATPSVRSIFLPVRVVSPRQIEVYFSTCAMIPENFRISQGIEADCEVEDRRTLLRALGLMDLEAQGFLRFEHFAPLPDLEG